MCAVTTEDSLNLETNIQITMLTYKLYCTCSFGRRFCVSKRQCRINFLRVIAKWVELPQTALWLFSSFWPLCGFTCETLCMHATWKLQCVHIFIIQTQSLCKYSNEKHPFMQTIHAESYWFFSLLISSPQPACGPVCVCPDIADWVIWSC